MITREQMVLALTRFELNFLIDNKEWLEDDAVFFAKGGYNSLSDEMLRQKYNEEFEQ